MSQSFASVEEAIADFRQGKFLVVTDDESRENEGDLIIAAQFCNAVAINTMAREARGLICVPMEGKRLAQLGLGPMAPQNTDRHHTAFVMSVDARHGTTTGISAADRARTIQVLLDPAAASTDLTHPGHMFPLQAVDGGVLARAGHTEAGVDLCRLAGLYPAAVICEILNEDGDSATVPELSEMAQKFGWKMITIEALIRYRRRHEKLVRRVAEARLPTAFGEFRTVAYESTIDGTPYVALTKGDISPDDTQPVLVRVHSGCLTGDALLSLRCDCGEQLHAAMNRINEEGRGVLLYIGHHEGRGIGILNKLRAYALQDKGADTEQANHALGFASDSREYGTGAQVLHDLGVRRMRLLTNNPNKRVGLEGYGLQIVERVPLRPTVHHENRAYLETKQEKMGHIGLVNPKHITVVTGAAGFIGSQLAHRLAEQFSPEELLLVDHPLQPEKAPNLKGLEDYPLWDHQRFLIDFEQDPAKYGLIFHLGACSSTVETSWEYLEANNLVYSQRLWTGAAKSGGQLIYASSAATYGDGSHGFDDEADIKKLQPLNLYGRSKHDFDLWVEKQVAEGAPQPAQSVGLKFFNVWGPGESHKGRMASMAFHTFNQIKATGKVRLFESNRPGYVHGGQQRDFVYVGDVVNAMLELSQLKHVSGLFNLGSGEATTFNAYVSAMFRALGQEPVIEYIPMPADLEGKYQYFTQATMNKLARTGAWTGSTPLDQAMQEYARYLEARQQD